MKGKCTPAQFSHCGVISAARVPIPSSRSHRPAVRLGRPKPKPCPFIPSQIQSCFLEQKNKSLHAFTTLTCHERQADNQHSGSNLSQGQRQLVSLARALLTPSNILVLDEATAAVDVETDALLQATLRSPLFSKRTIITIAHRINTILDSDRIVVLEAGTVKEFDTPKNLMESRGLFFKLVKEAGLVDSVR